MTSSQIAFAASMVSIAVSAAVLASAQARVLRHPAPRRNAYLAAWVVCALVLGGFRTMSDRAVGNVGVQVALADFAWMAGVSAVSLAVAHAIAMPRFFRLLAMHAAVFLLLFIFQN